jgi:hypothetical protein
VSEFEDKLGAILSDRNAMDQIMALARSFSDPKQEAAPPAQAYSPPTPPEDPTQLLSGVDPALLQLGMRLLGEYNRPNERSAALLAALIPYVRPERRESLQRAQRIARLSRVARVLLELKGKRGGAEGV